MFIFLEILYVSIVYMVHGHLINDAPCRVIGAFAIYFWHLAWNYFTCLAFEIMYYIIRPLDKQRYNRRFIIYNILSHITPLCYVIVGIANHDYGISDLKTCFAKRGSTIEVFFIIPFCVYLPADIIFM